MKDTAHVECRDANLWYERIGVINTLEEMLVFREALRIEPPVFDEDDRYGY